MDMDVHASVGTKPPPLTSDQLNYLIWRYLQESGYAEAAVRLQRDWKVEAESLPFAKLIKGQALVSLVQKGLRYHHLSLTIDEHGRPTKHLSPSMFYFGSDDSEHHTDVRENLPVRPSSSHRAQSPPESGAIHRKPNRDGVGVSTSDSIQAPVKRGRKPGTASGADRNGGSGRKTSSSAIANTAPSSVMDVDSINGHAVTPDPRASAGPETMHEDDYTRANGIKGEEQMDLDTENENIPDIAASLPPVVQTITNGESIGIQVTPAEVADLSPSSSVIALPGDDHITRVLWRPDDPTSVSASGDSFCGLWRTSDTAYGLKTTEQIFHPVAMPSDHAFVTAMAWEKTGSLLAVATYFNQTGQLHIYDGRDLSLVEALPASQRPIAGLRWLDDGRRLFGISPHHDQLSRSSSSILLWNMAGSHDFSGPLSVTVPGMLFDMDCLMWSGEQGFVVASGENVVYSCVHDSELQRWREWTLGPKADDHWTFVKFVEGDHRLHIIAAAAESARLWLPVDNFVKDNAHTAAITGLEIHPRHTHPAMMHSDIDFATSSLDGTIKIWRFDTDNKTLTVLCKLLIENGSPVMALSFSPDGMCLAGASYATVRIWNAEHGYHAMASWQGVHSNWKGRQLMEEDAMSTEGASSINGDVPRSSADHSLSWDVDSKKLAFGLGGQVAIITFGR